MMVELARYHQSTSGEGEDDGLATHPPILINPEYVSALFESSETQGMTVVRLADGRGFSVHGSYQEVKGKLFPGLEGPTYPHAVA